MNGTDRAPRYPYHHYHQHQYRHHYQQYHHHPLPSLAAAAAAGSFPFGFDLDRLQTGSGGGRPVNQATGGVAGRVSVECCYDYDDVARRCASDGVVTPKVPPSVSASHPNFRSCRPGVDARFTSAPLAVPKMTSQTTSPTDCVGKTTRPATGSDTSETAGLLQSSSVGGRSGDVYTRHSSDSSAPPLYRGRPSTDDNTDYVVKNENEADVSRDHITHADRKKTGEDSEPKHDVQVSLSSAVSFSNGRHSLTSSSVSNGPTAMRMRSNVKHELSR